MAYNPSEAREPAGTSVGGRWTSFTHASAAEMKSRKPTTKEEELNGLHYNRRTKQWLKADGQPVSAETLQRITDAKVKPGLDNVSLNPDHNAPLQARGVDAKGRTQYMYSAEHSEAAAAEKFARLGEFNAKLPQINAAIITAVNDKGLSHSERDAAAALLLIASTGIRVGGGDTGADVKAYGATTLLGQHVKLGRGDEVRLSFVGKSGKLNERIVNDKSLHSYIKSKRVGPDERVFSVGAGGVRDKLKEIAGSDFKTKDFRTWTGTSIALREVAKFPTPTNERDASRIRNEVARTVSSYLNNTPAVALQAYIDPAVFKKWGRP